MTIIGQLLWFCLLSFCLMIKDFSFVLMYHVDPSQLLSGADHLGSIWCMVFMVLKGMFEQLVAFLL